MLKENLDISNILKPFFEDLAKELQILDSFLREKSLIKYLGIDASLAPIPRTDQSIGLLYELMGINTLGNIGSLSITSKVPVKNETSVSPCSAFAFANVKRVKSKIISSLNFM